MSLPSYFSHPFPSSLPATASLSLPPFSPFFLINKEDYNQQFQEGNVEIDGSNDILTMALGTLEYSGCVRGMGFHISHRQYFHQPAPTKKPQSFDLKQWQDEQTHKKKQMLKEQEEQFKAEIAKIQAGQ
ncbi:hypothetical protein PanWU01x14_105720 [Parasponia andersonii]|uniref:Uncharacterized protein n=1 Tax=Parasponia andersonii TaxID=3476 RepID=A0A2P5D124_PARAD|nr:hypothetical protein PanWU01x14_105720 [Parasponia andersonii]